MALIGYTITVVAKQDNPYNVLPETDISIRKNSDNTLVNIYADEAGLIPIAQLGAKTDSNGQFTFYADASLGVLKAVWTNGGVIATEVLDQSDHSRLVNRNAVGAHDASAIDFTDYTSQRARMNSYTAGETTISGATLRDTFVTARTLNGLTDCHAFADRTIISNATDSGTYGTFDSTTEVAGSHTQSHQFSFQNRAKFSGSGRIDTWGGYISWPTLTDATSTVGEMFHFEAKDVDTLGRFDAITNQFGIKVFNQSKGISGNYAFWTTQAWNGTTGYSFYSSGTGKMLQAGEAIFSKPVIFGASVPVSDVPLSWTGGVGKQKGFLSSSTTGVQWGVSGDYTNTWVANGAERLILENSTENYALRPASSTQNLGTASRPFNEVKAKMLVMTPIASASVTNLSFFVDSADGKAKFKDASGVVNALY